MFEVKYMQYCYCLGNFDYPDDIDVYDIWAILLFAHPLANINNKNSDPDESSQLFNKSLVHVIWTGWADMQ